MKKHRIWNIAAHASIVFSAVFIVLFVLDWFNPGMGFLESGQSGWLLLLFCVSALLNGIISATYLFRFENHQSARGHAEKTLGSGLERKGEACLFQKK